jgi:hypothetical protein
VSARKARMILITELLPHILRRGVVSNEVLVYSQVPTLSRLNRRPRRSSAPLEAGISEPSCRRRRYRVTYAGGVLNRKHAESGVRRLQPDESRSRMQAQPSRHPL